MHPHSTVVLVSSVPGDSRPCGIRYLPPSGLALLHSALEANVRQQRPRPAVRCCPNTRCACLQEAFPALRLSLLPRQLTAQALPVAGKGCVSRRAGVFDVLGDCQECWVLILLSVNNLVC